MKSIQSDKFVEWDERFDFGQCVLCNDGQDVCTEHNIDGIKQFAHDECYEGMIERGE